MQEVRKLENRGKECKGRKEVKLEKGGGKEDVKEERQEVRKLEKNAKKTKWKKK